RSPLWLAAAGQAGGTMVRAAFLRPPGRGARGGSRAPPGHPQTRGRVYRGDGVSRLSGVADMSERFESRSRGDLVESALQSLLDDRLLHHLLFDLPVCLQGLLPLPPSGTEPDEGDEGGDCLRNREGPPESGLTQGRAVGEHEGDG